MYSPKMQVIIRSKSPTKINCNNDDDGEIMQMDEMPL